METLETAGPGVKKRYDVECAACGHAFLAAPSMAMEFFGMNTGSAACPQCRTYLHLEITPDLTGDAMTSIRHTEWLGRKTANEQLG